MSTSFAALEKLGLMPVAVSVDEMEGVAKTSATYEVPFALLSDPDLKAHEAYHVVNAVKGDAAAKLRSFGIDLERWSRRKHHKIAIPSLFAIDQRHVVRFAHAARDHRTRPSMKDLLAALGKLDLGQP